MINQVRNHAAANTKAMAMYGQLLDRKAYLDILDLDTVEAVLHYLKERTHYARAFKGDENAIQSYEIMMRRYFFRAYDKLSHFYFDAYRKFFKSLLIRYEVENVKLLARAALRPGIAANMEGHLLKSEFGSDLNYSALSEAKDMEMFMGALEGTPYYDAIKPFAGDKSGPMVFRMEMALDRLYFYRLYGSILALQREDQEETKELLGINIDVLNLQWIYRGRRHFAISPEELFNFTLDHGKKYPPVRLKEFCYMDFEKYQGLIALDDYGDLFKDREYMLERAMERYLMDKVEKIFRKARLSLSLPVCVLFMFEYELRDLFTIMEAKKYGFQEVEAYLIRDLGRE